MGTRADFYVGRGESAEWLGSTAYDGFPDCIPRAILVAADEEEYRQAAATFFASRDDATLPDAGWPWPWKDSQTTDYAYAFDWGKTWACGFGFKWFDPLFPENREDTRLTGRMAVFPNMTSRQNVTFGPGSGLIVLVGKGGGG